MESWFNTFRENIIGIDQTFMSPFGVQKIVYADWTASGRLYRPIEDQMINVFGPFVGNTHSEASVTGTTMTYAYRQAQEIIKTHVNAGPDDVIIHAGFGMTAAVNKFQRILGLRVPEQFSDCIQLDVRPVVFITHMEHHSNHTSWLETIADVVIIKPSDQGLVDLNNLESKLKKYQTRPIKIGAFTACSNVTGIQTPIHQMAELMHRYGGFCFVDYAASAPYVNINMHPENPLEKLDAVLFSPHKFLGGPGSSGVLLFDSKLYKNKIPDHPGGGTVDWTKPSGDHKFINNIELREDGGTPGFLQAIKTALAIKLKEKMGIQEMLLQEKKLTEKVLKGFDKIPDLHILAFNIEERLGIISFYVDNIHYNLLVRLLNDRYGIQVRGGCSCAGTYGHYLLHVSPRRSKRITDKIDSGDLSEKPGWVRLSLHPTMTEQEIDYIITALYETVVNIKKWVKEYKYDIKTNEFFHASEKSSIRESTRKWFEI